MNETPSYEMEIPCEEIMETMKKSIYNNFHNYSSSSINKDYISQRLSIFKILQKINMKMGFKSQTYFLSAYYLDILFMKKKKINMNLYKVGLAALCLSAKHCENDPIVPQLQYFVKIYNNVMGYKNIISMSDLMYGEVLLCKLLNYKLNYYSMYDFNAFFFCHGVLKLEQIKEIENDIKNNFLDEKDEEDCIINTVFVKNILSKIYKKTRFYLDIILRIHKICFKYSPLFITILIVQKSIEEVLNAEHKKSKCENYETETETDEFSKKNKQYFKEIMNDFYKIDFESNEQYKHLIEEDEIKIIFREKIKRNDKKNENNDLNELKGIKEIKEIKIELKDNIDKMTEKSIELSNDQIIKINKEKNNISNNLFNSSINAGFYKRLEFITNENENITNWNNFNFSGRNSINLRNNKIKIEHESDDLDDNLNINDIRKSQLLQKEGVYITKKINTNPFYRIISKM